MKSLKITLGVLIAVSVAGALALFLICQGRVCPVFPWQKSARSLNPNNGGYLSDGLRLYHPLPDDVVQSPLQIWGEAMGNWFFEATFPVRLVDATGRQLATTTARAQSDYMVSGFVPFVATLNFLRPTSTSGYVVLSKDNPSDLPENADEVKLPVRFTGGVNQDSGIAGQVVRGPLCPVERLGDSHCAEEPYPTEIQIFAGAAAGDKFVETITTDQDGRFTVALPPGPYQLKAHPGGGLPICRPQTLTVAAGRYDTIQISCDTGIR